MLQSADTALVLKQETLSKQNKQVRSCNAKTVPSKKSHVPRRPL